MKKILFVIIAILAMCLQGMAQTTVNQTATSKSSLQGDYVYYWGATTDTLVASDDITLDIRVKGEGTPNIGLMLYVTKVSGTVTNSFVLYYSMDGVNYTTTGDTITLSNASTGVAGTVNLDDFVYPYLRIKGVAGATAQKAWYKLYLINRKE